MTEPRLVLLLAWKIAEILNKSCPGDDCTPFAQDVILEVAAWLRKRNVRVRASVEIAGDLEREINQSQSEPVGLTLEELNDLCADHGFVFDDNHGEGLSILSDIVKAVLAHWGRPAIKPEWPKDEELLAAQDQAVASFPPIHPEAEPLSAVEYARELEIRKARAILARWGK